MLVTGAEDVQSAQLLEAEPEAATEVSGWMYLVLVTVDSRVRVVVPETQSPQVSVAVSLVAVTGVS